MRSDEILGKVMPCRRWKTAAPAPGFDIERHINIDGLGTAGGLVTQVSPARASGPGAVTPSATFDAIELGPLQRADGAAQASVSH
jgi:hypothetical protein